MADAARARTRSSVACLALTVLATALGPLVGVASPARAADEPGADDAGIEELGLQVRLGYGDAAVTGDWMPVAVSLSPRRAVVGTLQVRTSGSDGRQTQQREVELRSGATAVYRLLMPTGSAQVSLLERGGDEVTLRPLIPPTTAHDEAVIGLLDGTAQPPPVQDPAIDRTATWAALDRAWLGLGPQALRPLAGLVVDEAILPELDDRALRTLTTAVTTGLDLVVVATEPGPVDLDGLLGGHDAQPMQGLTVAEGADADDVRSVTGDGPAWTVTAADVWPDGDARTTVARSIALGRGRINVVTVAPGAGAQAGAPRLWSLVALGGAIATTNAGDGEWFVDETRTGTRLADVLRGTARQDLSLPWLAAFLLAYIVVVGPVSGALLARRKRRELTWVTVPGVAVVFTLAAVIGVPGAQPLSEERHTLRWWLDGTGEEVLIAGVRSPTEGVQELNFAGDDWTARAQSTGVEGATVRTVNGATTVGLSLRSLEFGGVIARRVVTRPPPLTVEATAEGPRVDVTVRNTGPQPLTGVEVRDGAARRPVGRLAPGDTAAVTVDGDALPAVPPYSMPSLNGTATRAADLLADDVMTAEPGVVWAVGVEADTTMAVGTRPDATPGQPLAPMLVDRKLVATGGGYRVGPFSIEGGRQAVVRMRVPATMAPAVLSDELLAPQVDVYDWRAQTWVPRADAFDDGAGDPDRLLSPTGEVLVRSRESDLFDYARTSVGGAAADLGSNDGTATS